MSTWLIRLGLALSVSGAAAGCEAPANDVGNEPSSPAVSESNQSDDGVDIARTEQGLYFRKSTRIAIVGAGPSGLTAADTLQDLGYSKVTVFEKDARVGGKVFSFRNGGQVNELGAVFASPDYTLTLGQANKYGIPYTTYTGTQTILDENGGRFDNQSFLTSRYTTAQILGGTLAYAGTLARYPGVNINGFAYKDDDLDMVYSDFAAMRHIEPITELTRSIMVGFGYGYYENVPAAYFMKLLPWLVKVGLPSGLVPATYYTFPTGFASVWEAVAQDLDVRLNSTVTNIKRSKKGAPIQITINNGTTYDFDVVIISAPLNKVGQFVTLTNEESELFSQVESLRYFVTGFTAANLVPAEALFFHGNANPSRINHVNVWANRDAATPLYIGYQIADRTLTANQVTGVLAQDVASQGGTFGQVLIRQEWDNYFPHVSEEAMEDGFYERVEALQGDNATFYVGGTLSFETVEHSARYAKGLVQKNFLPAVF